MIVLIRFYLNVVRQISTSVQLKMEDVALMPAAATVWEALPVAVYQDTPETDLPVLVTQLINFCPTVE